MSFPKAAVADFSQNEGPLLQAELEKRDAAGGGHKSKPAPVQMSIADASAGLELPEEHVKAFDRLWNGLSTEVHAAEPAASSLS